MSSNFHDWRVNAKPR